MNKNIKKYVTKSGKTRYMFRLYLGKSSLTGESETIAKRGFKTEKEAENALLTLQLKINKGEYVSASKRKPRLTDLYNMWIKLYKKTVGESTLVVTERYFKLHILKQLGNIYLDKLNVLECQKAVNVWYDVAPVTFKRFVFYASKLIRYGIDLGLMKDNPMSKVVLPKKKRDTKKFDSFYTKDELNIFLKDAKQYNFRYFVFFRVLAYSGMRKAECLALNWSDIDFLHNTININKSIATGKHNRLYLSPCKTKDSVRVLDMDSQTMNYLKEWRTKQRKEMFKLGLNFLSDDNLVFANTKGKLTVLSKPQRWDKAICKKFGLRYIKVHGFRHTHASLLFEANTSLQDVKERLGHSDIKTTMNVYTHVTKFQAKKTALNFAKYMES